MTSHSEVTTVSSQTDLHQRYDNLMQRVAAAAQRSGRRPKDIIVVLVSKYGTLEQIRELTRLGHRHFGESRALQLEQRSAQLSEWMQRMRESGDSKTENQLSEDVHWHMVGHVQRNKARKIIHCARLIHSVDSLRLAEEVQAAAARRDTPIEVLLQVNVSGERQKNGIAPPAIRHLIDQIDTMVNVRVRGLMCMAAQEVTEQELRQSFERCHELYEEICTLGIGAGDQFNILSMGMSSDFEVAIESGANCVRIGRAIFQDEGKSDEPSA